MQLTDKMSLQAIYNTESTSNSCSFNFHENTAVASPPLTPVISSTTARNQNCATTAHISSVDTTYEEYLDLSNCNFAKGMYSPDEKISIKNTDDIYHFEAAKQQKKHKHVCHYNFCGWSFKRYEHLKRHMLVHTGERPHQCPFMGCGKRFSRSDNFHAHYRTHTKSKICATTHIKKKSAAVTTVSAAVTGGVTSTLDDSSGQYSFLPNQKVQNSISPNKNAASSIAATAAVVAVQQQQNQQVFYNSRFFENNASSLKVLNTRKTNVNSIY